MAEFLDQEEKRLELLERASQLKRRKRRFEPKHPEETWVSRWVSESVSALFPLERREEWLGDLYELNWELFHKGRPRWLINTINLWQTILLVAAALQIKFSNLFTIRVKKTK